MNHKHKPHHFMLAALLLTVTTAHGEEIKLRNNGDACTSSNEGAIYYDDGDDTFYFCRNASTGWEAFEDLAPASSGGGKPTYMGVTTATTDGAPSQGLKGLDAMCAAEYTGSRIMRSSDYKYISANITADYAWFHCDDVISISTSKAFCGGIPGAEMSTSTAATYPNCRSWGSTGVYGAVYNGSDGSASIMPCNSSYKLHCVKD
jgi:hypothetical protein